MDDVEIPPQRAAELIAEGAQVVDVREPYEVEAGHLEGARHVQLGELAQAASSLDRETPIVFYCRVGARSAMAAHAFRQAGFEAYTLSGGLLEWAAEGRPLDPPDGTVAAH